MSKRDLKAKQADLVRLMKDINSQLQSSGDTEVNPGDDLEEPEDQDLTMHGYENDGFVVHDEAEDDEVPGDPNEEMEDMEGQEDDGEQEEMQDDEQEVEQEDDEQDQEQYQVEEDEERDQPRRPTSSKVCYSIYIYMYTLLMYIMIGL